MDPTVPYMYLSAPTSPTGCSPQNQPFYTAPSSPVQQVGSVSFGYDSGDVEFEFETSQRLANGWDQQQLKYRLPGRANSFSTMAFADELFFNGQVLPLKLPPPLQSSVPTSPRSRGSVMRLPFSQKCTWNDSFDPFMVALEKVSEETSARMSVHRRSRSDTVGFEQEQQKQTTKPGRDLQAMMERKGSMYSRWVRSQTMVKKRSESSMLHVPTGRATIKGLWQRGRVRDADFSHNEPIKDMKRTESSCTESKMQKVKSVLLRYASLKKETSESKQMEGLKTSYFKKMRLSFKANGRKKALVEPKMAVVKHDPRMPRCFIGYA